MAAVLAVLADLLTLSGVDRASSKCNCFSVANAIVEMFYSLSAMITHSSGTKSNQVTFIHIELYTVQII